MQVSQLFYYPVKSLGVVDTQNLLVTEWGPHRDRRMMLVDENGKFVTQRQCNQMALFKTKDDGDVLNFEYNGQQLVLPWPTLENKNETVTVSVWGDEVAGERVSKEADDWFSQQLGRSVSLVYMAEATQRQVDLDYALAGDKTGFSDGFPFLMISEASLAFLQKELPYPLDITRFRPNIVVSGCEAFAEDSWKRIAINGIEFDVAKPCSRCVIPTLNPQNGEKQPEVMKALLAHRKQGNKVYMGQNLIHRGEGKIEVGNTLTIIE